MGDVDPNRTGLYWRAWRFFRDLFRIARPVRTNVALLLILLAACTLPAQARDMFRSIATGDQTVRVLFFAAAFLTSAVFGFTSDALARRSSMPIDLGVWARKIHSNIGRILAAGPFIAAGAGFLASAWAIKQAHPDLLRCGFIALAFVVLVPAATTLLLPRLTSWLDRVALPAALWARGRAARSLRSTVESLAHPLDRPGTVLARLAWFLMVSIFLATLALSIFAPHVGAVLGPGSVLFLAAACWSLFLCQIVLRLARFEFPLLTLLAFFLLLSQLTDRNDNHAIRTFPTPLVVAGPEDPRAALARFLLDRLESPQDRLDWERDEPVLSQHGPRPGTYRPGHPFPVFLVAAEGGGLRNAYWTASALAHVHDLSLADPRLAGASFGDHVFAISGVSGGSVGASVFVGLLANPSALKPLPDTGSHASPPPGKAGRTPPGREVPASSFLARTRAVLGRDLLSPLLARGAVADFGQQFIPFAIEGIDRARTLEGSLERAWRQVEGNDWMQSGFFFLHAGADGSTRRLPRLILNTTEVETGSRVPISHLDFHDRASTFDARLRASLGLIPPDADTRRLGRAPLSEDLRMSTAAMLSARFPLVTPAGTLVVPGGKLRFVDGGYYENSGCESLADLLEVLIRPDPALPTRLADSRVIADARFVVIRIRYLDPSSSVPPEQRAKFLNDALSPVRALTKSREAHGQHARDLLDRLIRCAPEDPVTGIPIVYPLAVTLDCADLDGTPLPLGWILSSAAKDSLDEQIDSSVPREGSNVSNRRAADLCLQALRGELFSVVPLPMIPTDEP